MLGGPGAVLTLTLRRQEATRFHMRKAADTAAEAAQAMTKVYWTVIGPAPDGPWLVTAKLPTPQTGPVRHYVLDYVPAPAPA